MLARSRRRLDARAASRAASRRARAGRPAVRRSAAATPTRISQPRGLSGTPSSGHCRAAASSASCDGVLGGVEVAVPAHERREDVRRGVPPHVLVRIGHWSSPHAHMAGPQLDGAARLGEVGGDLLGPLAGLAVDQEEAGQLLLGLGVRAVGGQCPSGLQP